MLEVPVGIYTTNTDELLVIGGGEYKFVPFPVMPFMITEKEEETEKTEKVKIIGSTLTSEGGKGNRHSGIMTVTPGGDTHIELTYLPTLPFGTNSGRVIDIPSIDYTIELVKEFPEKLGELIGNKPIEPYPLFLDIETATTEEHFPRPDRDPIVSIQLKYRDSEMMILLNEDPGSAIAEIDMLLQFILALEMSSTGKQPDFVVGYFLNKFDIPYIKTRIKKLQPIHPELMTKFQSLARLPASPGGGRQANLYYPNWTFSGRSKGEEIDMVPGLLTLDLFKHAKMDHALTSLPSRSLKRVSTAFGHEVFDLSIDEKKNMKRLLKEDKDRFLKYAGSDILATEYVYGIYESRLISSANLLQCPMSLVHRMSSGQKSYLVMYRECRKNGYYSLNANSSRYFLYDLADKYQGALVDCYHRGYFEHIVYLDAKALYPNIMHDLNVSYDRYTLESVIWYSDWEAEKALLPKDYQQQIPVGRDQRYTDWPPIISYGPPTERIIYIPDDNYRVVLKFKFDLISDGFIRKLIVRYNSIRDGYKAKAKEYDKKYKESGNIQDRIQSVNYDSAQAEAKVINNTFYGIQGNRYYDFADLPAAIFVTAIGRWIMTEMVNLIGKRATLEIDTDGCIVNEEHFSIPIDEINKKLRNHISEFFGMPEENLKFLLELENRGSIYLHKAKNYILRKDSEPDKLTTVGSAFKGYDKAEVIQNAVRLLSTAVMYKANDASAYRDACEEARDVYGTYKTTGLESFRFTKIIRRNPHEYKGYRNVDVATSTVDRTQSKSKILSSMKKKAIVWINTALGKTTERSSNLRRKIRACKDEEQLKLMLTVLAQAQPEYKTAKKHHLTLDIIMRLMQRGRTVEADDTIEYYYTLTKEQYTLAEDMTEGTKLDFHKYLEDINSIIKRFSLADPRTKSLTMMDLIDDPDSAEDLQNSSAGFDEDEDEEDLDV